MKKKILKTFLLGVGISLIAKHELSPGMLEFVTFPAGLAAIYGALFIKTD